MLTLKGITRKFRKTLHRAGHKFPLTGPFTVKVDGIHYTDPTILPKLTKKSMVECIAGAGSIEKPVILHLETPAPTIPDRQLFKRIPRNPDKNGKIRNDYKPASNPKPDDGVTYYAKINSKWREVPANYADPSYTLKEAA